jgi:predicted component of type VI protein secretion system
MKAELIPLDGGRPIPITRDVTVVGRREYCDVRIDDPSLSKRHCVLVKTDGLLVIRDLATTNGTKVKGQKIKWAALLPEDRIALGTIKFRIYLGPDDVPSPSEQAAQGVRPQARAKAGPPAKATNGASAATVTYPPNPPARSKPKPSPIADDPPRFVDANRWRDSLDEDEEEEIIELD